MVMIASPAWRAIPSVRDSSSVRSSDIRISIVSRHTTTGSRDKSRSYSIHSTLIKRSADQLTFPQQLDDRIRGLVFAEAGGIQAQLGVLRSFVVGVDAGEVLELPAA